MNELTLKKSNARLTRNLISWQAGAIGLLVLSTAVNAAMLARIDKLEAQRQADAERYQEQIQQAEHVRDLAVQELGAMTLQAEQEQEAREVQTPACEAVGEYRYIGECTITAYCCEPYEHICGTGDGLTATGIPVTPGIVAVDAEVIPLGSTVIIDGQRYLAADTGVSGLHVDVAVPTHAEALEEGVRTAEVWVAEPCEKTNG